MIGRIIRALALTLLSSSTALAVGQPINEGDVIALRNSKGQWLSADKNGKLFLSSNPSPAAWEEWQISYPPVTSNAPAIARLVSFHGTQVMHPGTATAAPLVHGYPLPQAAGVMPPSGTAPSILVAFGDTPTGPQTRVMTDGGLTVVYNACLSASASACFLAPATLTWGSVPVSAASQLRMNGQAWTVVRIGNPTPGRAAMRLGLRNLDTYKLKTTSGQKLFQIGAPPNVFPLEALQGPTGTAMTTVVLGPQNPTGQEPLYFNTQILLGYKEGSTTVVLLPGDGTIAGLPTAKLGARLSGTDATLENWEIVDPTGTVPKYAQLWQGAPFCLKNVRTGRLLSADPGNPKLRLSPNTCNMSGTWEQFTAARE